MLGAQNDPAWPLLVYFIGAVGLTLILIGLSAILGQRHSEPSTGDPYESGISSFGSAHLRISAQYYLVALFFVIFDLEAVFLFAWAIALREVGWTGYIQALIFIGILAASLVYLWRDGALDWGGWGKLHMRSSKWRR